MIDPILNAMPIVLSYLTDKPQHIDDLRRMVSLPLYVVCCAMAHLELEGKALQVDRMLYIRAEGEKNND